MWFIKIIQNSWVNYNNSLTWNKATDLPFSRPPPRKQGHNFGDDFPNINHDSRVWENRFRSWWNLPWHRYIYRFIYVCLSHWSSDLSIFQWIPLIYTENWIETSNSLQWSLATLKNCISESRFWPLSEKMNVLPGIILFGPNQSWWMIVDSFSIIYHICK